MIIITGANGFVGQRLAPLALKYFKASEVVCLVNDSQTKLEKQGLEKLKKAGLKTIVVDLVEKKGLNKIPKSPSLILHLAANTDTSVADHRPNDIGTLNLLNAVSPLSINSYFIYTSTTVLMSGRPDCSKPFNESDKHFPTNEYSRSKLRAENLLKERSIKDKFSLTIIRINTIYGNDPRPHKMFKVLKKNIESNSLLSRVNWPGLTSIIHVDDVVAALLRMMEKPSKPGKPELYLLGSESLTMSEISKIMHERMGVPYKEIRLPSWFWWLCAFFRRLTPVLEKFMPAKTYNLFWRTGLIIDDVIFCKSNKLSKILPGFRPRKFLDAVEDELT